MTEPAADEWAVERLVEAACAARQQGAPESEAVFLRRALAELPSPDDQSALLLDLGIAEANAGLDGWAEHLKRAVDAAPNVAAAAEAAMVLAHALSRAQRFAEAVEVLDRASLSLDPRYSDLAILLETAAVVPAMNDPTTSPSLAVRREALRGRAVGDPVASAELLAALAFCSVLRNEPSDVGADLATRALEVGGGATAAENDRPWFSFATWFPRATLTLFWAERYAEVRPLLDALTAQAGKTGDSSGLHIGLANRSWLALRRGDLSAAEEDARTALASAALPVLPMSRVSNSALLVEALVEQGELEAAEEALAPLGAEAERETLMGALLRFARGRLRIEQERVADALEDFLAVGVNLTRAGITCPSYVPWRSEAALAHLALGDR